MAINRFDRPAQYNPIDTYVPIPFQEIAQAAAMRQRRADEVEGMESYLGDTSSAAATGLDAVRLSTGELLPSTDLKGADEFTKEYNARLSTLADKLGTGDRSDPLYRREVMKLTNELKREMSSTGRLGRARQNAEQYKIMQKTLMDNQDAISKQPWLAAAYDRELKRFADSPGTMLQSGVGIGKFVDVNKIADELVSGMEVMYEGSSGPQPIALGMMSSAMRHGVDKNRVAYVATNAVTTGQVGQSFAEQGQYLYERNLSSGMSNDEAKIKAEASIKAQQEQLVNSLVAKYTQSTVTKDDKFIPEFWAKMMGYDPDAVLNPDKFGVGNVLNYAAETFPRYDKNGKAYKIDMGMQGVGGLSANLKRMLSGELETGVEGGPGYLGATGVSDESLDNPKLAHLRKEDPEGQKQLDSIVATFKNIVPGNETYNINGVNTKVGEMSSVQILNLYKDAVKSYEQVPVQVTPFSSDKEKKSYNDRYITDDNVGSLVSGKRIVIVGVGNQKSKEISGDQLFSKKGGGRGIKNIDTGGKLGEITKVEIVGRSTRNPFNMPGAYAVKLTDDKHKSQTILVQASENEEVAFAPMMQFVHAAYSGRPVFEGLKDQNGIQYTMENIPTGTPQLPFDHRLNYIDVNGKPGSMRLDAYLEREEQRALAKIKGGY